jgi:hypothetical protein
MSEHKGNLNAYICDKLHATITVTANDGTTPMFISCPECEGKSTSRMGKIDSSFKPTFEWFTPNEKEIEEEIDKCSNPTNRGLVSSAVKEHVKRGGLLLRKIKS